MKGKYPNGRWGAGTNIKTLQSHLTRNKLTLTSHPSIENGTLGGWIASGSHGSGGTLWKPNFGKITVMDQRTKKIFQASPKTLFHDRTTIAECRNYLILDVEITPSKDVLCKRSAFKVFDESDVTRFLETDTYLRMLQLGARGILALMWTPVDESEVESSGMSNWKVWFQSDILSILQSGHARSSEWFSFPIDPPAHFETVQRLSDANKFTPEPLVINAPLGLGFVNFEVFLLDYEMSPSTLLKISNAICDLFTHKVLGRCEVRCGKTKSFFDFVIQRGYDTHLVFECLYNILGDDVEISLHRGKAQVPIIPFERR